MEKDNKIYAKTEDKTLMAHHHIPTTITSVATAIIVETETKHQPPSITTFPKKDPIQHHYCHRHRDRDNTNHIEHCKNNQIKQTHKHN
ncbi:hypothetical protein GBA52_016230 [Prunus armeniaca]|nr:hypothetical protein GBA52_016230 [Prunus armeniaca]